MKNRLVDVLDVFQGVDGNEAALDKKFLNIARYLLSGGYFLVNSKRKIYLTDIEFYYHEEGSGDQKVKDPSMYHTYDHEKNTQAVKKNRKKLPYFPVGSLNAHNAGIDITFENKKKQYRAACLIRGYRIEDGSKKHVTEDDHPTYIYDNFLMGIPLSQKIVIEWRERGELCNDDAIEALVRVRIPAYEKDGEGNYITDERGEYIRELAVVNEDRDTWFKSSNEKIYKQCGRKWRFRRK